MPRTHFGTLELPRDSSHDIHSISSTHSNTDGTQATAIGSVGVCTNQHHSRIGIVLQDDLAKERDISQSVTHFPHVTLKIFGLQMPYISRNVSF